MAKTPSTEQDLIIRAFYEEVAADHSLYDDVNDQRAAYRVCLKLLGLTLVDGKHVRTDRLTGASYSYGSDPVGGLEDAYQSLAEKTKLSTRIRERLNEATNKDSRRDKANSGKPSESPSVWQTIFRKDV